MRTPEQRQTRSEELKKQREQHVASINAIDGYLQCLADEEASPVVTPPASPQTGDKGE